MGVAMKDSIVFFGSGPVAAQSLELLAQNFTIEAVVTKPQPTHHRQPFPVLVTAEQLGLKVFTPNSKKELSDLFATKPVKSRLGVVIDYGFIINQDVINYFLLGIVNSHFSLLPQWRGADPISFAILSGQQQTGVSLMLINEKMDEGPLLAIGVYDMDGDETTPVLTNILIHISDTLLRDSLPKYVAGKIDPAPQLEAAAAMGLPAEPSYSRKLTKADGLLDWNNPAVQLEREIRAFIEWPKSRTTIGGKDVVITKAHVEQIAEPKSIGTIFVDENKCLAIQTNQDLLIIDELKPAGKQQMTAQAFLAGYSLN
jgi:methionyl-tRNA formyltransferase